MYMQSRTHDAPDYRLPPKFMIFDRSCGFNDMVHQFTVVNNQNPFSGEKYLSPRSKTRSRPDPGGYRSRPDPNHQDLGGYRSRPKGIDPDQTRPPGPLRRINSDYLIPTAYRIDSNHRTIPTSGGGSDIVSISPRLHCWYTAGFAIPQTASVLPKYYPI